MININQKTPYDSLNYTALKQVCASCTQCDLHQTRTNVVVGTGPVPCNLMIIGEGPGEKEDLQGEPFIGKAGILLNKILDSVKINRKTDAYITNIVKCRPPNNRAPHTIESSTCSSFLLRQIQLVKPKIIILLGSPSLKTILDATLTITKSRGQWFKASVTYMPETLYIMPMFHPSYLLRHASKTEGSPKWLTWKDMQEVKSALNFYNSAINEDIL